MGAPENKQLIQHMFTELNKGNLEAFLGVMAEDIRWTIIGTTKYSGTFQGKQEILDKLLAPFTAQLAGPFIATVERLIAEDDYVVMQERGHATTKSGKPYNNTYCVVFRMANGKVQEIRQHDQQIHLTILRWLAVGVGTKENHLLRMEAIHNLSDDLLNAR